jgi:hypothetical protein
MLLGLQKAQLGEEMKKIWPSKAFHALNLPKKNHKNMLQPMLSGYMICLILDFIYFINVVETWTEFFFSFRSPIFSSSVLVRFE